MTPLRGKALSGPISKKALDGLRRDRTNRLATGDGKSELQKITTVCKLTSVHLNHQEKRKGGVLSFTRGRSAEKGQETSSQTVSKHKGRKMLA